LRRIRGPAVDEVARHSRDLDEQFAPVSADTAGTATEQRSKVTNRIRRCPGLPERGPEEDAEAVGDRRCSGADRELSERAS
jgi:hypothetical protein